MNELDELELLLRFSMEGGRILKTYVDHEDAWMLSIYKRSLTAKEAFKRHDHYFIGEHKKAYPQNLDANTVAFIEKYL